MIWEKKRTEEQVGNQTIHHWGNLNVVNGVLHLFEGNHDLICFRTLPYEGGISYDHHPLNYVSYNSF